MASQQRYLTEKEIDYLENRFREIFPTRDDFKSFRSDIFDKLDEILTEVVASREERIVANHQIVRCADRLEKLEKLHPQGKHLIS